MVYDNPPSYDSATGSISKDQPSKNQLDNRKPDAIPLIPSHPALQLRPGPSYNPHEPIIHHYVHPATGEHIATPLPPDHPEMICLQQGEHVRRTKFGLLGIMAAVFFFPLGVALCLIDRRVKCDRCGRILEDGVTCG